MKFNIHESWMPYLKEEFEKPYFLNLIEQLNEEYNSYTCFPPVDEIFNAFNYCHFDAVNVVIIGQDPYHDYNQANGLCFSVNDGIAYPPSLRNIFKEIEEDLGTSYSKGGNLKHWANQGVLLLNATLTVRAHKAGSHQKLGWEIFTNEVIKMINEEKENIVFLLWGGFAKTKKKLIDTNRHHILETGHPSPLSANRGYWFGNNHFSKTNYLLEQVGLHAVHW